MFLRGGLNKKVLLPASTAFVCYTTMNQSFFTNDNPLKYQYNLSWAQKSKLKCLDRLGEKARIVTLYDSAGGTSCCDLVLQQFERQGLEVVKVTPSEGLEHPIFQTNNFEGIYLPGGPDIPTSNDSSPRKIFERQLIVKARESDIPLLGICRGHQAIGHSFGFTVENLQKDQDEEHSKTKEPTGIDDHYGHFEELVEETGNYFLSGKIEVEKGSQLHKALQHEFKNHEKGEQFVYGVSCMHYQHVTGIPQTSKLKVTARRPFDNTVESVELSTGEYYTIGFQHHPETVLKYYETVRKDKLTQIHKEMEDSEAFSSSDPEIALFSLFKTARQVKRASHKSREERAARAQLRLFTDQVNQKFLSQPLRRKEGAKEATSIRPSGLVTASKNTPHKK